MRKKKTNSEYDLQLFERELDLERLEDYITARTPILHRCIEDHTWKVAPDAILSKGRGCPICAGNIRKTTLQYNEELIAKKLNYTAIGPYINWRSSISHRCNTCEYIWNAIPNNILSGQGCPSCAKYGFDPDSPAILYYIKIGEYYKVGITKRNIKARFSKDPSKPIIVIRFIWFEKGKYARELEQELLSINNRITVPNYLVSGGNTELFLNPIQWIKE